MKKAYVLSILITLLLATATIIFIKNSNNHSQKFVDVNNRQSGVGEQNQNNADNTSSETFSIEQDSNLNVSTEQNDSKNNDVSNITQNTELPTPPAAKTLQNNYHIFQTFNNCGPAAMSMALSYYGINQTQQFLGSQLRPYQVANGDNDDKSVTLKELAEYSKNYDFIPYLRPNGDIEIIKQFINQDIPIITRTWLAINDDIGHYRIIKGYDQNKGVIIQDDSLQGKNLEYSYGEFNAIWQKFNYEFLVLVPKQKQQIAEQILGINLNEQQSWRIAVTNAKKQLQQNPNDVDAQFNLSVAYYNVGNFEAAVTEFEKVESRLSKRTLWYQIEPIKAYYELGNFDKVFEITNYILNNNNRAFSELYIIRGDIYYNQGQFDLAKQEYEKAILYNSQLDAAKEALEKV